MGDGIRKFFFVEVEVVIVLRLVEIADIYADPVLSVWIWILVVQCVQPGPVLLKQESLFFSIPGLRTENVGFHRGSTCIHK